MVWVTKSKALKLTKVTGHPPPAKPSVHGRAPQTTTITFTPAELFGAMARCSHLHVINPSAATPEAETCRHLLHQYVDDGGEDFAILKAADRLKDFSRTHLAGVVGAGISYLQMIRDGYTWFDHFENLVLAGPVPSTRSPDFVFSRNGYDAVAVSESKATRGSSRKQFDGTVKRGYVEQVSPYLGRTIGSSVASHGFSIGSWMTSATCAEILVHHTEPPPSSADGPGVGPDPIEVRRGNYLNILSLLLGPGISRAARGKKWSARGSQFVTARWLGHDWLLGLAPAHRPFALAEEEMPVWAAITEEPSFLWGFNTFALELEVARRVFQSLETPEVFADPLLSVPVMDDRLIAEASNFDSAVFPDGFAVIGRDANLEKVSIKTLLPQNSEGALASQGNEALEEDSLVPWGYEVSDLEAESNDHSVETHQQKIWLTE
ncbi:hypothetical protein [Rhizobium leguminosarum]|uniref:hypothetical protein n=1 Tax=Rhizobium leguminosarum TaxID=384 RepID=UPI0014416B87|nr:hypothetical protein [Rhizobium leguminosarum]MBY5868735.1 hypothetical protein [Rhizobium leguminosarum]NKM07976.1 hypothetical protein [Rhizobium leguminosarum bv. viciae]